MIWTIVWFAVAALAVAVDQISKVLAVKYLADGPVTVIPHVLDFTYVENDGMALGLMDEHRWVFITLSTVAIVGLIVYLIGWKPKSKFACAALALILGGGIGNMIDRFFYVGIQGDTVGEKVVRDFIDVNLFGDLWPWVFNIADACVCVGGAMLFVWCLGSLIKESIDEKKAKTAAAQAVTAEGADGTKETEENQEANKEENTEENTEENQDVQ